MKSRRWLLFLAAFCLLSCLTCGFGYRFLSYSVRQSDLDIWTDERPFNREAWINKTTTEDCAYPGVHYQRGMMLDDMNRRYSLEEMKPAEIRALLGPPDGRRVLKDGLTLWEYELGVWDYYQGNYLTLVLNSGRVQAQNYGPRFTDE